MSDLVQRLQTPRDTRTTRVQKRTKPPVLASGFVLVRGRRPSPRLLRDTHRIPPMAMKRKTRAIERAITGEPT